MTNTQLLDQLLDTGNDTTWQSFVDRHWPMVVRYARRLGAGEAEAEDLAQTAIAAFAQAYADGRYDRTRGRLRSWMFAIAHRQIMNGLRRRAPERTVTGSTTSGDYFQSLGDDQCEAIWESEWADAVVRRGLDIVRHEVGERTWDAFELFACREWPAARVAEHLDISEDAVFGAKRRILARLRELRDTIDDPA